MIAFVTQPAVPEITADDELAAELLRRRGKVVRGVPWDAAGVDWREFECVVVRSPWDYYKRAGEFMGWVDRLDLEGVRVWNPAGVLRWNAHKGYLVELAGRGVAVVPTTMVERGSRVRLGEMVARYGSGEAVVKPAQSAGAIGTWVTSAASAGRDKGRWEELLERGDVLVQPLIDEVRTAGEWSLVFFNGVFSHAVVKRPKGGDFRVQEEHGGRTEGAVPPTGFVEAARRVLAAATPEPLLYARVDGVDVRGVFTLMELEVLEPMLFLGTSAGAGERFADAVLAACG